MNATKIRAFVKHLWEECHDGGDFESTQAARKLDQLLNEGDEFGTCRTCRGRNGKHSSLCGELG